MLMIVIQRVRNKKEAEILQCGHFYRGAEIVERDNDIYVVWIEYAIPQISDNRAIAILNNDVEEDAT